MLIVLEGVDGSGKSTISSMLCDFLRKNYNVLVINMAFPSNEKFGIKIHELLKNNNADENILLDLFINDFKYCIDKHIKPNLDKDVFIVLDRYIYSFMAYQSVSLKNKQLVMEKIESTIPDFPIPDIMFVLDFDISSVYHRIYKNDFFELKGKRFLQDIRSEYHDIYHQNEHFAYLIDSDKNIQDVFSQIINILVPKIPVKNSLIK